MTSHCTRRWANGPLWLQMAQTNCVTTKKELLAMVEILEEFRNIQISRGQGEVVFTIGVCLLNYLPWTAHVIEVVLQVQSE